LFGQHLFDRRPSHRSTRALVRKEVTNTMAAILAPYTVVMPHRFAGARPSTRVFLRRRLLVSLVLVAVAAVIWLGAGNVLANRGGDPASASTVRPASAAAAQVYVAKPGDTLWSIAVRFHGSVAQADYVDQLIAANGGAALRAGQSINLP